MVSNDLSIESNNSSIRKMMLNNSAEILNGQKVQIKTIILKQL